MFDEDTRTFIYRLSDSSEIPINFSLQVFKTGMLAESGYVCEDSELTNGINRSLVLSCALASNATGSYYASVYITPFSGDDIGVTYAILIDGEDRLYIDLRGFEYNKESLFWSFILLLTMIAVGAFAPIVGVALYLVSYVMLGAMGFISMSYGTFIGVLVIGVIFIWALARKET